MGSTGVLIRKLNPTSNLRAGFWESLSETGLAP